MSASLGTALAGFLVAATALIWQYLHTRNHK